MSRELVLLDLLDQAPPRLSHSQLIFESSAITPPIQTVIEPDRDLSPDSMTIHQECKPYTISIGLPLIAPNKNSRLGAWRGELFWGLSNGQAFL